jgi:hypothetical protein
LLAWKLSLAAIKKTAVLRVDRRLKVAGLRPGGNVFQAVADEATSFIDSALLCITQVRQ